MKKHLYILCLFLFPFFAKAQNVGIGISSPLQKLHIEGGNFLITQPLAQTSTPPTAGQTITMVNGVSTQFQATDSTGYVFDPGGPAGNYIPNLVSNVNIPAVFGCVGFEVTISTMGLGTGDSLVISESSGWNNVQLAVGNNYSGTGTYVFNTPGLFLLFKSNADASVGPGFTLVFKRKYDNIAGQQQPSNQLAGKSFLYNPKYSSLQIGTSEALTDFSTAIGSGNTVGGANSLALGQNNYVISYASAAIGVGNEVTGSSSAFALGVNLMASSAGFPASQLVTGYYNAPSQGLFVVGRGSSAINRSNVFEIDQDGNTNVNGFTRLGKASEGSPIIKIKKINGFTPATQGTVNFYAHGITQSKILSISCLATIPGGYKIIPNHEQGGFKYTLNVDNSNIAVGTVSGNSGSILNAPVVILITYEE